MQPIIRALCGKCRERVPVRHEVRDGKVFLCKDCPDCGVTEAMVSSDAQAWQRKRDIWHYAPPEATACTIRCDQCRIPHNPSIVFLDVTNRCNMMCPICIANVRGMGFDFHPPMAYFEKVFRTLATYTPLPIVELFGGEPTLRDDLLEIIKLARSYGIKSRVVTNGVRLADEEYCRKLCEAGARFRLALDGRDPEIYNRLRKNSSVYDKKIKALENLRKYSRRKNSILCCAARKINEQHMADLIDCCHEHMDCIDTLGLIPLTETWESGTFETDVQTTREDAEHMVEKNVRGGNVEFIPAGIACQLQEARSFFRPKKSPSEYLMLGGVHPDCESLTLLVSDGQHYRSINDYLKIPLSRVAEEILSRSRQIKQKLGRLDRNRRLQRMRGQYIVLKTFLPLVFRAFNFKRLFKGSPVSATLKVLGGLIRGRRFRDLAYQHLNPPRILRVVILPFEEFHSIDSGRLENCKSAFAYEDTADGMVKTVPLCVWGSVYRNDVLRKISEKYGKATRHAGTQTPMPIEPHRTESPTGSAELAPK